MAGLILILVALLFAEQAAPGQTPEYAPLEKAYQSLRNKDYDQAVEQFKSAILLAPDRASIRKDLAYTLLKIGETEAARDQFGEAMRLDPADEHVALEYAFLCNDTHQVATARRIFDRLRGHDKTAAQAFENIDRPLREGIARWSQAVELSPDNFSAREELAKLAAERDELDLAGVHYEQAWRLRPDRRDLLLELGRVWKRQGREEDAMAAWIAASRGAEPRVAAEARELLPDRYPYVYEFQKALALDPSNVDLRRELAYLDLQMDHRDDAQSEFQRLVETAPGDLLSIAQLGFLKLKAGDSEGAMPLLQQVLAGNDDALADRVRVALHLPQVLHRRPEEPRAAVSSEARKLAEQSLEKGYLKDALKYLQIANENDPLDFEVMLKLGWTYNILKDDRDAVRWFNLARRSPDPKIAAEASRAYHNLEPDLAKVRTTVWLFPMFSSRWHDVFAYAQAKTELRPPHWFLHPYLSVRFIGDTAGAVYLANLGPEYLSERSAILAAGVATPTWRGMTGWFEAGESLRWAPVAGDAGRLIPDYRGGISYAKGVGNMLATGRHGWYSETNDDGIFVSRFGNDSLLYSQNRGGYTLRSREGSGGFHAQFYWNFDVTADLLGQYWANYVETGPGVRFRFEKLRPALLFSVNLLRGVYLINQGNPRGPTFNDVRVGVWYAFSR